MNLGIVIGVSEYSQTSNNLPGCQRDAELIHEILLKTQKYEDIFLINKKISSAEIKKKLTDFISINQSNKIEELFFYFTGHGEFYNEEFYYLLSDFDEKRRNQSTFQNNEIDSLIRTLNPDLVVKVIDACQSGKTYIKESDTLSKHFEKTQNQFNKCYFLNSSMNDQSSYQSSLISDFTKSFVSAVVKHESTEIRFKDIIDFISDEFESNPRQTPFFIIQADYTEKFCEKNQSLVNYFNNIDLDGKESQVNKRDPSTILEKIKKDAEKYIMKDNAIENVMAMKSFFESLNCKAILSEIFNLEISFHEDYNEIVKKNIIAKWLKDNDHDFFAKPKYLKQKKDRNNYRKTSLDGFLPQQLSTSVTYFHQYGIEEYEMVLNGFDVEIEVPYKSISMDLNSKFPNVDSFACRVVYFLSKKQIIFFYFITNFEEKNWDERYLNEEIEWISSTHQITDKKVIFDGIQDIFSSFEEKVNKYLEDIFGKKELEEDL